MGGLLREICFKVYVSEKDVNLASSHVAMIVLICLAVFLIGQRPFWLWWRIVCCTLNVVRREVSVLVNTL